MYNRCCLENCASVRKDVKMHRFPTSETGLKKWLKCIGSVQICKTPNEVLRRKMFVCHKHFEKRFITESNRLHVGSYPTLFSESEIASGLPSDSSAFIEKEVEMLDTTTDHSYAKRKHEDHTYAKIVVLTENQPGPSHPLTQVKDSTAPIEVARDLAENQPGPSHPVAQVGDSPALLEKARDAMTSRPSKQAEPTTKPQDTDKTCKQRSQKNVLNPFPCNICKLRFPSRQTLNKHQLSHEHKCEFCKRSFDSRKVLFKHNCYMCKICNKLLASPNQTWCRTCRTQFTNKTDLVKHVNTMKLPCKQCGVCFKNLRALTSHNTRAYRELRIHSTCNICKETFEDYLSATSHSRSHVQMRCYSREPKSNDGQTKMTESELANDKEQLNEDPVIFKNEPNPQGRVGEELEDSDNETIKQEPYAEIDLFEATDHKIQSVNEFDIDEVIKKPNQNGFDFVKPKFHEDVKVETYEYYRAIDTERYAVTETTKHVECVKVERIKDEGIDTDLVTESSCRDELKLREALPSTSFTGILDTCAVKLEPGLEEIEAVDIKPYKPEE